MKKRRSNHRGNSHGSFKNRDSLVRRLVERDGLECAICYRLIDLSISDPNAKDYVSIDHILPMAYGGTREFSNLQLAHQFCNNERGRLEQTKFGNVRSTLSQPVQGFNTSIASPTLKLWLSLS